MGHAFVMEMLGMFLVLQILSTIAELYNIYGTHFRVWPMKLLSVAIMLTIFNPMFHNLYAKLKTDTRTSLILKGFVFAATLLLGIFGRDDYSLKEICIVNIPLFIHAFLITFPPLKDQSQWSTILGLHYFETLLVTSLFWGFFSWFTSIHIPYTTRNPNMLFKYNLSIRINNILILIIWILWSLLILYATNRRQIVIDTKKRFISQQQVQVENSIDTSTSGDMSNQSNTASTNDSRSNLTVNTSNLFITSSGLPGSRKTYFLRRYLQLIVKDTGSLSKSLVWRGLIVANIVCTLLLAVIGLQMIYLRPLGFAITAATNMIFIAYIYFRAIYITHTNNSKPKVNKITRTKEQFPLDAGFAKPVSSRASLSSLIRNGSGIRSESSGESQLAEGISY